MVDRRALIEQAKEQARALVVTLKQLDAPLLVLDVKAVEDGIDEEFKRERWSAGVDSMADRARVKASHIHMKCEESEH